MDPTKSFDHLDPKLKETYARVMGVNTNGSDATPPNATDPSAPVDPTLSATPTTFDPAQTAADPNQLSSSPFGQDATQPTNTGPNPGTGPTINSLETADPNSMFSTPASSPDGSSPTSSPFFSNPSPATIDPSQQTNDTNINAPIEAPTMPVTPYAPVDATQNPSSDSFSQPLPSPATVNQAAEHETSPLLKVLYIIGAVVFFAVYTIFWIKIFNLPFLF